MKNTSKPLLPKELTAMAFIITGSHPRKVLLVQSRKHRLWMPPGGHVESYENPLEAAIREAREETGLDIAPYLPSPTRYDANRIEIPLPMRIVEVRLMHGGKEHYHVDCMYRVEVPAALAARYDEIESSNIGWFTAAELNSLEIPADILPVLEDELGD